MTNKHTPGPWKLDGGTGKKGELFVWSDRGESRQHYIGSHEVCVAVVKTRLFEEGQDLSCIEEGIKANAELIRAAPELYEQAMWILRLFGTDHPKGKKELKDAVDKLRDILGRIEGGVNDERSAEGSVRSTL